MPACDTFINFPVVRPYMGIPPWLRQKAEYYLSNLALIWLAIAFYRTNSYYAGFLRHDTQQLLLLIAAAYTVFGLLFYAFLPLKRLSEPKGAIIIRALLRLALETKEYLKNFTLKTGFQPPKIAFHEKTAILFMLVKIFFLPIMANFLFSNLHDIQNNFASWQAQGFTLAVQPFNSAIYPLLLALILFIDTAYFSFGYAVESSWLGNKVRSVEPTAFGWIVALVCYPPFNTFFSNYIGSYADDYTRFPSEGLTMALRLVVLALFLIYLWATLALGAKCSNLTNRGIVSHGPYAFVRHPAYAAKNLAWLATLVPLISIANPVHTAAMLASTGVWALVYFLRAITEERHLIADKDYQEYCRKVRYRFIPGIF